MPEKKKSKKKWILAGAVVLVAAGAAAAAFSGGSKDVIPTVSAETVKSGDITSVLDTSGTVVSLHTKTYFSPVNANIKEYGCKVGQIVKRGETLVTFNTDTLERDNQRAELTASTTIEGNKDAVAKTEKTLQEADTASVNQSILEGDINNFKAYIEELTDLIADRTRELSQPAADDGTDSEKAAQLTVLNEAHGCALKKETLEKQSEALQAEVDNLIVQKSQAEFDGDENTAAILGQQISAKETVITENQKLIDSLREKMGDYNGMSAQDIQDMITALSAELSEAAASAKIIDPSQDEQIQEWQRELQDAQSTLAELQSDLAEAKAKVEAGKNAAMTESGKKAMESTDNMAELEASTVEELLEKGKKGIQAEFNGIVTRAELTQGAAAAQGMELVTVSSNEEVAVRVNVSKYDYSSLKEGQKATVTVGDYEYSGTVSSISRVASVNEKGAPVIVCEVTIDNPDDNIFLGMEAKAQIITSEQTDVLTIPVEAVNTGKEGTFCYTLEDGIVKKKAIEVGTSSIDASQVVSGLKKGEVVITDLPDGVEEGSQVQQAEQEEK